MQELIDISKDLQREQTTLSGDKELKANTLRNHGDQISRKTVELGQLRAQADQRKRDEAALRELEEYLGQLQADLKVRLNASQRVIDGGTVLIPFRHSMHRRCLRKHRGGRRTISSRDTAPKGRTPRTRPRSMSGYIGRA